MSQLCFDQTFKISFTQRKVAGMKLDYYLGKKKKLLTAGLFMGNGCTVYISKCLECEQLPLLLSYKVSCSL